MPAQVGPGLPGGAPLPNNAAPGTAYGLQQKAHPASVAGMVGPGLPSGMANAGMPPTVGAK